MLSRAEGRRAFFFTPIIVDRQTRTIGEALRYNGLVFVAADGGFFCRDCVSSPCDEMADATLADLSEVFNEGRQWCIIGAQEPALGHGDTCDHCGTWALPKPTDADADAPIPSSYQQMHIAKSRNPDPRWVGCGGDCDGGHDA